MQVNGTSQLDQAIKIFTESLKTDQQIAAAVLKKGQDVEKTTADAMLKLLQSSASLSDSGRRLDVRG